jgi:hypothetical protein
MITHSPLLTSEASWLRFREEMAAQPHARDVLASEADPWLTAEPVSLVHKKHLAPSGDPHDYISMGPYWWPDPAKPDGLPWVRRDGEVNPRYYEYDSRKLETFFSAVTRLVLQAYATDSVTHARAAGKFLRAWFLDAETRMNPHLRYAQFIPGICDGRGIGIIDTTLLVFLLDMVTPLEFNDEWKPGHLAGLKDWFSSYLDWLLTSVNGKKEGAEHNNHGTWYDAQIACFATFCGKPEVAAKQIDESTKNRLSTQLRPDGSQPHELARTLSFTYCTYNLLGFACLARISQKFGLDLWRWESPAGSSLLSGVRWMLPYYSGERAWTHQQLKPLDLSAAALLLNLAGEGSGDKGLTDLAGKLAKHPWQKITFSKAGLTARKDPPSDETEST